MCLDPANVKSSCGRRSLIDWASWVAGTGDATSGGGTDYYNVAETAGESTRALGTDPWGRSSMLWNCTTQGTNNADGGFTTSYVPIAIGQTYRFSVWFKRTSATTTGTAYFGLSSDDSGNVVDLDDDANEGNPYWHYGNLATFTQNTWYLFVGHAYLSDHSSSIKRHPESGVYTIAGGRLSNCSGNIADCKWTAGATQALLRSFMYYCTDAADAGSLFNPRIDVCDGSEPSIAELLNDAGSSLFDITGNGNHGILVKNPIYAPTNSGIITLNGTDQIISVSKNMAALNYTVFGAVRYSGATRGRILSALANNWLLGNHSTTSENYYAEGWITDGSGHGANDTNWRTLAGTGDILGDNYSLYVNGVEQSVLTPTGGTAGPNGLAIGSYAGVSEFSTADVGIVLMYDRTLTANEVLQNHIAVKGRYGL
jgi:hypothetical protein